MNRKSTIFRWVSAGMLLALALLWAAPGAVHAQQPAEPAAPADAPLEPGQADAADEAPRAPGLPGRQFFRFAFLAVDQMSYIVHPFFTMTGDSRYTRGATGDSTDFGVPNTDSGAPFLERVVHALPPFALEIGQSLDFFAPKGISIGLDFSRTHQSGKKASGEAEFSALDPTFKADTYYFNAVVRMYFFDPTEPGLNYFFGFGLGVLDGKMAVRINAAAPEEVISYNQVPIGTMRLGLESKGDNFGFRYELMVTTADKVILEKNPIPGRDEFTTLDFSGTLVRISLYYQFGNE